MTPEARERLAAVAANESAHWGIRDFYAVDVRVDDLKAILSRLEEVEAVHSRRVNDLLEANYRYVERARAAEHELSFIAAFADIRSRDESKVFARVNRGALRNIAERARSLLNPTNQGE